jgi:hypothetical protein
VPNLMTDRGFWLAGMGLGGNVRRLMYQPLIWPLALGNEASGLCAPLYAKDLQGLADTLVDGVRRNPELGSNLFGVEVLVDEQQAVELAGGQPRHALRNVVLP